MGDVNTPSGECVFFRDKCSLYPDKCDLCKVKQINSVLVLFERLKSLKERNHEDNEMLKNFIKNSTSYFFNNDEVLSMIINIDEFIEITSPIVTEIYIKVFKEFENITTKDFTREPKSFKDISDADRRYICEKTAYLSKVLFRMNTIYEFVKGVRQPYFQPINPNISRRDPFLINMWWKKLINIEVCLIVTEIHHGILDE